MPTVRSRTRCTADRSGGRAGGLSRQREQRHGGARARRLRRTPAQVSHSLLRSCSGKRGRCQGGRIGSACASLPPVPGTAREQGGEPAARLNALFRQWQLLPAAILPRGHLPVTSQTCNPRAMGEQPSSRQEGLGPGGSRGCCQNNSSNTQPLPSTLQSGTRGRRPLRTGRRPNKLSHLPPKPARRRMSTRFLQHTVVMFPNRSVPLIIGPLFVRFPSARIRSTKEGPGLAAPAGSSGNGDPFLLSHGRAFVPARPWANHVHTAPWRCSDAYLPPS